APKATVRWSWWLPSIRVVPVSRLGPAMIKRAVARGNKHRSRNRISHCSTRAAVANVARGFREGDGHVGGEHHRIPAGRSALRFAGRGAQRLLPHQGGAVGDLLLGQVW